MLDASAERAPGQDEALRRTRKLSGLLVGLERQFVFLASAEDRALKGAPLEHDPAQLRELHIPLATSRSLLATAARERRTVRAQLHQELLQDFESEARITVASATFEIVGLPRLGVDLQGH